MNPTYVVDHALDTALDHRVELHQRRDAGDIDAPAYLEGLRQVREVEDALEPIRRSRGATTSRAFELARSDIEAEA